MNPRLALTFTGIAAGCLLLAYAVGIWFDHALTQAFAGIGVSSR